MSQLSKPAGGKRDPKEGGRLDLRTHAPARGIENDLDVGYNELLVGTGLDDKGRSRSGADIID